MAGMDSRDLTQAQLDWLDKTLSKMAHELCRIHLRLNELRIPQHDQLRILVYKAYDAVLTAEHHTHSLCCQGKMGTTYFFVKDGIGSTEP